MSKIVIVHFQPLEKYPPVMNLIRFLARVNNTAVEIHVITTMPGHSRKLLSVNGIQVHRVAARQNNMTRRQRLKFYLHFNKTVLSFLRRNCPGKVLYYETLSGLAPCLYKKYFNKESELYIHYHEYTSPKEYAAGMLLNRLVHRMEKKLYGRSVWISHTNELRMKVFMEDIKPLRLPHPFILPNYPPEEWKTNAIRKSAGNPGVTRFVYVGALSLDTMFVKAFATYVKTHEAKCLWDIYSDNHSPAVVKFLQELGAKNINFKGDIEYDALPGILAGYDIGVILYKGHIPNYIYNAPNKLFEYLACDLEVWFPTVMEGCRPYCTEKHPAVRAIDFDNPGNLLKKEVPSESRDNCYHPDYFCERILPLLTNRLLKETGQS